MNRKIRFVLAVAVIIGGTAVLAWFLRDANFAVLNPKGWVASQQKDLIIFTLLLSAIVVIPVFALTFMIAWKYRAGNTKAKYTPDWDKNALIETIWWGIPCAIILVLGIITWQTSHSLDPYKPLNSEVKPLNVQVVALEWKWLFIYPDQGVASVNLLEIPEDTPINFTITSDAPMNSFWIPSLGGQVYAMSGMSTKLHLIASEPGDYRGSSANISGEGFSKMAFTARAAAQTDFNAWVKNVKKENHHLTAQKYDELAKPAVAGSPSFYVLKAPGLYDKIVMKYMAPEHMSDESTAADEAASKPAESHDMKSMPGMEGMNMSHGSMQ